MNLDSVHGFVHGFVHGLVYGTWFMVSLIMLEFSEENGVRLPCLW